MEKYKPLYSQVISEYRKKNNISQLKLAELIGKSYAAQRRYEAGTLMPTFETMVALSEVLHFDLNELLTKSIASGEMPKFSSYVEKHYEDALLEMKDAGFLVLNTPSNDKDTISFINPNALEPEIKKITKIQLAITIFSIKKYAYNIFKETIIKKINSSI